MACPRLISRIRNTRNIGDSLLTLNTNFYTLDNVLCDLKQRVESLVEVRTFFYYGPNQVGANRAVTDMRDGQTNRPSNTTIENFVNNTGELNLAANSKQDDVVNIIYQKTGFIRSFRDRLLSGNATAQVISFSQQVPWITTIPDQYNKYVPVYIIWKLVHDGTRYSVSDGFPLFTQNYQVV